jgi:hypothetical protein
MPTSRKRLSMTLILTSAALALAGCQNAGPAYTQMVNATDSFANQGGGVILERFLNNEPQNLSPEARITYTNELRALRSAAQAAQAEIVSQTTPSR